MLERLSIEEAGLSVELGIAGRISLLIWHWLNFPFIRLQWEVQSYEMCFVFQSLYIRSDQRIQGTQLFLEMSVVTPSLIYSVKPQAPLGQGAQESLWYLGCTFFSRNEMTVPNECFSAVTGGEQEIWSEMDPII